MTDETIVAVYDTAAHAEAAVRDLTAAGVPQSAISQHADTASTSTATTGEPVREQGFWSSLFGGEPDHDTSVYDRSVQSGSTVVTVRSPESHVTKVTEILESHHPIDIDDRASGYGASETTTTTTRTPLGVAPAATASTAAMGTAATDADKLQLSEERLSIGKRLVNRGGTRIRRFVVETPVEEEVRLRSEKVTLERHPVTDGRAVNNADFSEKTIEMSETAEEAVVGKSAYVREEVSLRKEATERVETVHDTVRREDVEVEQIPVGTAGTTTTGTTTTGTSTAPASPLDPRTPKV